MGLGTQGNRDDALSFVRSTGVRHPMVWDQTSTSWRRFGIVSQPTSVVVSPDGTVLALFPSRLALDEVLAVVTR